MTDKKLSPEVVAVIVAAVQKMIGGEVHAVKIKPSENWALESKRRR